MQETLNKYQLPKPACSKEEFLHCVKKHQMRNYRPDSPESTLYKHLIFADPENNNQWFEIVTWPGNLTISGDMGTYVFSRETDMFGFFRRAELKINPDYWSEKCVAADTNDPIKKYNPETFLAQVMCYLESEDDKDLMREVEEAVLPYAHESEHEAMEALHNFHYKDFAFYDFESDCTEFTYHFLWCLYAVVWAIQQYDISLAIAQPMTTQNILN